MKKGLTEMTLEELWERFPIVLTEHKTSWNLWYKEEFNFLQNALLWMQYDASATLETPQLTASGQSLLSIFL